MTETQWWTSRALWAALVAVGMAMAGLFEVELDAVSHDELVSALLVAAAGIGATVTILKRFQAKVPER